MAFDRYDRWVQIVGALGIVAGLLMVGLELKQSARLVRAELGAGSMAYRQSLLDSIQGEELAEALAQAVDDHSALSSTQQVILNAWYQNVMGQALRQSYLLRLNVFKDPLEPFVRVQAHTYFGNAYAQSWWQHHRQNYPTAIVEIMDRVIRDIPPDRDARRFRGVLDTAQQISMGAEPPPNINPPSE